MPQKKLQVTHPHLTREGKPLMVADLHCDLLAYLSQKATHTPYDAQVRCSIPQLKEGGVKLQTLAIFSETVKGSQLEGQKQFRCFTQLPILYAEEFALHGTGKNHLEILVAFENSSAFCGEDEPLDIGLNRLKEYQKVGGPIAYVSMTWNFENRFGGGALTSIGLKPDGEKLLEMLSQLGIPVDLSHASDKLAEDILNILDKRKWHLPVLASHSNFRALTDVPRNLTDELACEIIERGGIIGLAFPAFFTGEKGASHLIKHVEHGLKLGGTTALCFGADFFYEGNMPKSFHTPGKKWFYSEYANASHYPKFLKECQKELSLSPQQLQKLAYDNLLSFLSNHVKSF